MRISIRLKLIVPMAVGLVLIAVATAVLMRFVHDRGVDAAALRDLERTEETLGAQEEFELDRLSGLAEVVAGDDSLAAAMARRDREALLAEVTPLFEKLREAHGVTHLYFHDPDPARGVFLRAHRPDLHGDQVHRPIYRRAVETGREASGREFGRTAFAVRVVRPWRVRDQLIGYLELGTDMPTFLGRLKRATGDDFGMVLDKRQLDPAAWAQLVGHPERWEARPELVAIAATSGDATLFGSLGKVAQIPARPTLVSRVAEGGRTFARGLFPLRDGEGAVVGAVAVLHEITPLLAGMDQLRLQVVVLVVLLAAALAALVSFLLETLVFERVERMSRVLEDLPEKLARGEWELSEAAPRADDEIGRVEGFLDRAVAAVGSFVTDARRTPLDERGRRPFRGEPM